MNSYAQKKLSRIVDDFFLSRVLMGTSEYIVNKVVIVYSLNGEYDQINVLSYPQIITDREREKKYSLWIGTKDQWPKSLYSHCSYFFARKLFGIGL